MKKILFLLPLLLWACNKNGNLKPSQIDSLNVKSSKSISFRTNVPKQKNLSVDINGVKLFVSYIGNGIYDFQIQVPYDLFRDDNDGWTFILRPGFVNGVSQEYDNKGRFFEFQATLAPGSWRVEYSYTKVSVDAIIGETDFFNIIPKPADPGTGLTSLYRYYNQYNGGYHYTSYWEQLGSYSLDYQFQKIQGFMYTLSKDPYTLLPIYVLPQTNYIPLFEFYNSAINDYVLSTNINAPTGYVNTGVGALGYISKTLNNQFDSALNEYVNSNTGQHVYLSENLPAPWSFSKTIGYLSSNSFTLVGNTPVSGNFTKSNCGPGYTAILTFTIPANTFYSDNLADANAEALLYLNANGPSWANAGSASNCVLIIQQSTAAFNMRNTTSTGFTLTFSGSGSPISINLPASTNSLINQIPFGTYTLTISPSGFPTSRNISLGARATITAAGTTFTNVNISTGSSDLSLVIN